MAEEYLIHGGFLKCSAGSAPSQIIVTSNHSIFIQQLQVATELDKISIVNIQTFGLCSITQKPCIPAPLFWQNTHDEVEICGLKSLTKKSCINCGIGGKIDPVISGQTPSPAFSITNNNESSPNPMLGFLAAPALAEAVVTTEVVVETSLAAEVALGTLGTAGVLVADDVTVVGVADDVAIPVVLVVGLVAAGAIALWELFDEDEPVLSPAIPLPIPAPAYPPSGIVETEPKPIPVPIPIPIPIPIVIPDDKTRESDPCEPIPIGYHRGGNLYHNQLADSVPPNRIPGTDWLVKGKAFDAYSTTGVLWEIKTDNYSQYKDFVKRMQLNKLISETVREKTIANSCGYPYTLGVTDIEEYNDLEEVFGLTIDIVLI